jgi:pimeloyl-ACP methyl ester carboxylesterase
MSAKHHRYDPPFFAKCKNLIIARGGSVSDDLCDRGRPGEQSRRVVFTPPGAPVATAVFLHGTGNDLTYPAVALYRQLFAAGIRVCAFDLDGHGAAGSSRLSADGIAGFVDWCLAQAPAPADQRFIIGHSFGGTLALDYAARHPQAAAGLILISAPLHLSANLKGLAAEAASLVRPAVWQGTEQYGLWGILPALGPFKRSAYPVRLTHPEQDYVRSVDGIISGLQLAGRVQHVQIPVLLIYGTGDLIVPISNQHDLAGCLPRSTSMIVKGATHFSTILEPGVSEAVAAFIGKQAAGEHGS